MTKKLAKAQVKGILEASFPDYKGRTFSCETADSVFIDTMCEGGSCQRSKRLKQNADCNWTIETANAGRHLEGSSGTVELTPDSMVVVWSRFCGKDMGIKIVVSPDSVFLQSLLPKASKAKAIAVKS